MRIAIVGCGVEGSTLAGLLAREEIVEQLILVSRDGRRAEDLKRRLIGVSSDAERKVACRAADATDSTQLRDAVEGAGLVVNATLPEANVAVLTTCLEVSAAYIDMVAYGFELPGTPRSQTVDACLDFDESFRRSGLVAFPNTGASPGLTDVVARHLADQMDHVDRVTVMWADRSDARQLLPPFTPEQVYSVCMPSPVAWETGRLVEVDLLADAEDFDWPDPIGSMKMFPACHMPETRTLQYVIPGVRRIEVKTGLAIGQWRDWTEIWVEGVRRAQAAGTAAEAQSAHRWLTSGFGQSADYSAAVESGDISINGFGIAVIARGHADNTPAVRTVIIWTTLDRAHAEVPWANAMSHLTAGSTPREIALMLCRGEIEEVGVVPSVGTLSNAQEILGAIARRPFLVKEDSPDS